MYRKPFSIGKFRRNIFSLFNEKCKGVGAAASSADNTGKEVSTTNVCRYKEEVEVEGDKFWDSSGGA